jgi:hypothetical protein
LTIVLLGPQRFDPTLAEAAEAIGVRGRIGLVTAGWQEREAETAELDSHLGGRTVNLELHRRADELFRHDTELAAAYRKRQLRLRQLQEFYRVRLVYLVKAARVVAQRVAPPELLAEENHTSIEAIRVLDRYHVSRCANVHAEFRAAWTPDMRPSVLEHREQIAKLLETCNALAIAGGHVATILNRLRLFGVADLMGDRPLLAWSAGAMAVTGRVVLFHDDPPHGVSAPQLLDGGLDLVKDVVALPNPKERLRMSEPKRMAMYAERFAPATCLALPRRSWVVWRAGTLSDAHGVLRLDPDGSVAPLAEGPA